MATLQDFDDEERSYVIECVHALDDTTSLGVAEICGETGLSRGTVRG